MHQRLHYFVLAVILLALVGCSERVRVSSDYVLVRAESWNPDGHPGTKLHRGHKVVWGNVYSGYFDPSPPSSFARDGMMVFVGPLPVRDNWYPHPQFFALRGDGPPVVLDERLFQKGSAVSNKTGETNDFEVRHLAFTNGVFRVEFECTSVRRTYDVSWADIKRFLDESESTAKLVQHPLGDYRLLP